MQFLFDASDEMGLHTGLGLIPGRVTRFEPSTVNHQPSPLKVPHMGWNQLEHNGRSPLLQGIPNGAYTYFVHSYYCIPTDETNVSAWTEYGRSFASVVGKDNIFGLQFHPEKSQSIGLRILKNFAEL
jgi:glutamine amidotransferase